MRTIALLALCFVFGAAGADESTGPVVVSAASPTAGVTADSLASIFGSQLSTVTQPATSLPWPYMLGDIQVVYVKDSTSQMQMASLIFVSPSQINIWIPPGVAPGPATVLFPFTGLGPGVGTAALHVVPVTIQKVAPGLFSADGTGTGVAAASAVEVAPNGTYPVPVLVCDAVKGCAAAPINLGLDTPIYLSLYGTGIRGASSPDNVVVTIGSVSIKPSYVGPQMQTPGLDQINVPMPLSLRGSGLVNVTATVDGVTSNAVQIDVQ